MYFIHYLPPSNVCNSTSSTTSDPQPHDHQTDPVKSAPPRNQTSKTFQPAKPTTFPKSLSISELLNAGRLIKPKDVAVLELESFHAGTMKWNSEGRLKHEIEGSKCIPRKSH